MNARADAGDVSRCLLAACGAIGGIVVAFALLPLLHRPAPPGQLPGLMTAAGLDAHGPFLFVVAVVILSFAGAALGARLRLQPALRTRNPSNLHVRPGELVLVPAFLASHLALLELLPGLPSPICALIAAALVALVRFATRDPDMFAATPLAFVAELRLAGGAHPTDAAIALAWVLASPLLLRLTKADGKRLRVIAYPLGVIAYAFILVAYPTPVLNLFEHGFGLGNASEMLHGETLYRDLLPQHGPLADGVIDWIGMRAGGETLGAALDARLAVGLLGPLALYVVAVAATGNAGVAFVAAFAAVALFPASVRALAESSPLLFIRTVPSLFALAAATHAARRRSIKFFGVAGALLAVAWVTSVEFAVYALIAVVTAAFLFSRSWRVRARALRAVALGALPFGVLLVVILAATGLLSDYARTTFVEIPRLAPAYNLGFITAGDASEMLIWGWLATLVGAAALLAASRMNVSRRTAPLVVIASWIVASGVSFAERKHLYFATLLPILGVSFAWHLVRSRRIVAAGVLAVALLIGVRLPAHILTAMPETVREREAAVHHELAAYDALPRARGALIRKEDIARLDLIREALDHELPGRNATFYSFTNLPVLYFLFDRRMPIRYPEVPMYESAAAQQNVIATLDRDRTIQLALVSFPFWANAIDDIPNSARAPAVRDYLVRNFEIAWAKDGLILRRRRR